MDPWYLGAPSLLSIFMLSNIISSGCFTSGALQIQQNVIKVLANQWQNMMLWLLINKFSSVTSSKTYILGRPSGHLKMHVELGYFYLFLFHYFFKRCYCDQTKAAQLYPFLSNRSETFYTNSRDKVCLPTGNLCSELLYLLPFLRYLRPNFKSWKKFEFFQTLFYRCPCAT